MLFTTFLLYYAIAGDVAFGSLLVGTIAVKTYNTVVYGIPF